ncbi:MAG: DUF1080 domain-containing protein [Gemmatimonadales bacterium]|nr:MAG: DUF1080 domain-containing protein [Gemmatimonadales bacterium]
MIRVSVVLGLSMLVGAGVGMAQSGTGLNALTVAERAEGWQLLFDGRTTDGWRGYQRDTMPSGWQVVDGALTRVARGGDIITREAFSDFELSIDWNVEPGGNSGVFYRASEETKYIYHVAPELQVVDDDRHPDGVSPLTSSGSAYGLYAAPRGVVKPAGEWNTARIMVRGNRVEHWLNGTRVVEYELGGTDWASRVANSKFAQWPKYGTVADGHIGLQDHGGRVAYRNIKIRRLP